VLFIKDGNTGEARASVLFPVRKVLAVRNSAGDVTYENGKDYIFQPGSREILLPAGSRIREPHIRETFAWLNRFTLSLLKQHPRKDSIVGKRRGCGWSENFMLEVLTGITL
jgi:hypothetical protein